MGDFPKGHPRNTLWTMTNNTTQALHRGQALHDVTLKITLVDVTQWTGPLDERLLGRKDAVFLCFGSHEHGRCALPLNGQLPDPHGIVLAGDPSIDSHNRLVQRYRQLVRKDIPVSLFDSKGQVVEVVEAR